MTPRPHSPARDVEQGAGDRGRAAETPTQIPVLGWKDIGARVRAEAKDDNVALMSAGVAFYGLLAMVPGLVALLSVYALVSDPNEIRDQVVRALSTAPKEVRDLVAAQLTSIAERSGGSAIVATVIGLAVAVWAASSGVSHLIDALNVAYDEHETRNWLRRRLIALAFTVGGVLFFATALAAIAVVPRLVADARFGWFGLVIVHVVRWVTLLFGLVVGLAVLYRFGPDRDDPKWRWVSPGALVGAGLWTIGSFVFSIYTSNFGKYNETYGSLGAVVVLMLWLFLTAASIVVGAELNAEMEKQTARDSTVGPDEPMGERGATAADVLGQPASVVRAEHAARRESHGDEL